MTYKTIALSVVAAVFAAVQGPVFAAGAAEYFPGAHWETMSPAEAGLDAAVLEEFSGFLQGRGCVVRHGKLVYTWGDYMQPGDVASAVKPFFSYFLFRAIELGKLPDADAKASAYVPCLEDLNPRLGHKDRGIRFRHLATQTSCYGVGDAPGTAFDYNDWQMALFMDTLFQRVYGAPPDEVDSGVLHPLLTDVLGCEDAPALQTHRLGRLRISPRDFCRFGYLFLHEGRWNGRELLSREHARLLVASPLPGAFPRTQAETAEMCPHQRSIGSERIPDDQCDHKGSYSWLWWINGVNRDGERNWTDAPTDAFAALGHHNGMRGMAVIPSLDLVAAWNDTAMGDMPDEAKPQNTALGLLRKAAAPEPMDGQIVADPQHPAWLARYRGRGQASEPFFLCGPGDPEDFLYRGERKPDGTRNGDQARIIAKMQGTGANGIYLQAVRSHGGDGGATHNPFVDNDPARGLDENILVQWETWFRALDDSGIAVLFFFYDDSVRLWPGGDDVPPEERAFLEAIVRRFEHHRNWIWCVAEEYGETLSPARVRNIAAVIRAADKHQHVIAVHKNDSLEFGEFAGDENIGQFAVQYNQDSAEALHEGLLRAWRDADGRYNLNMSEAAGFGFGTDALEKYWACAMAGANAMALGWDFNAPDTPGEDGLKRCGYLVRFFENADPRGMAPHDELRAAGTRYVLAEPGKSYILYVAEPGAAAGIKDLPKGSYALDWLDTATGQTIAQSAVQGQDGDARWDLPAGIAAPAALHIRKTQ